MATLTELLTLDVGVLLDRVCAFTAGQREALHRPALQAWERYAWRDALDGRKDRYTQEEGRRLELILAATAPAEQLTWPTDDQRLRIARSRGSRFLHALARHTVRTIATTDYSPDFGIIRRAERDGLVTLDADDDYVLAMVNQFGGRFSGGGGRRADLLRADPELLARAFWRIFEIEGNRQVSLANVDKYRGSRVQTWHDAVLDLLSDGTIDRARVLDATVAALGLGFPQYRAGWYSRLHAALAPSADERAARQAGYAMLLRSSVGPTVALAVDALTAVQKAGRLDHDSAALTDGLAAAVLAPAKSTATKALALAARVGSGQSSVIVAALGHPHPDVQAACVEHLRARGERGAVLSALPALAPAVAAAARGWLGVEAPPAVTAPVAPPEVAAPELEAVAPITEPAELAEAFAILLADPTDAELLERALCAAARLGPDPGEYAGLAAGRHACCGTARRTSGTCCSTSSPGWCSPPPTRRGYAGCRRWHRRCSCSPGGCPPWSRRCVPGAGSRRARSRPMPAAGSRRRCSCSGSPRRPRRIRSTSSPRSCGSGRTRPACPRRSATKRPRYPAPSAPPSRMRSAGRHRQRSAAPTVHCGSPPPGPVHRVATTRR
ncbi:DUF6493 family protein [Dactylosporangium sp. NBC_01737]|uniref:DUF6493 family protein n=1 Tax=Dactylosporangium sp. NBC_01737 TaxID=2975959 RepID=UPI002E14397D|nr:DUF6493 family protein [Dactylosporangium sp. NBC_01737]